VRRFQNVVRPYAKRVYAAIALVMGIIAGLNATGQWQKYLLFSHAAAVSQKDPVFHKDLGFYVFTLPFVLIRRDLVPRHLDPGADRSRTGFHFLNGGIRTTRVTPRVSPRVKAHLSVIGAAIALMKAAGYLLAKWELVKLHQRLRPGRELTTDIHARMPALTILFYLSLAAAANPVVQRSLEGLSAAGGGRSGCGPSWRSSSACSIRRSSRP